MSAVELAPAGPATSLITSRTSWVSYPVAIGATIATAGVRYLLGPWLEDDALLLPFVVPIIIASRFGGIGPGLVATGLSMLLAVVLFLSPLGQPGVADPRDVLHLTLFAVIGLTVTFLNRELQRARDSVSQEQDRVAARERELRQSRDEVRALTDSMPQIVFSATADGRFDYFNQRWFEYTGDTVESANLSATGFLHPEDVKPAQEAWRQSIETGDPYEMHVRIRARNGAYGWFISRAIPLRDDSGEITRWLGTSTDVDEQRRMAQEREALLESERAARGEAERATRQKDEFVATLSHELRTPLNAILGWMHLLREDPSPETRAKGLEVIERNAKAQSQLISDLLDISRITSGKIRLELRPLDPAMVVSAAVETLQPSARSKDIRIRTVIDTEGSRVAGDPDRLQQVTWNLLSNAVKFTPRGGQVDVTLQRAGAMIELRVADSGPGIPADALPFIFDRYRQADSGTTRKHSGLGLGLSIAKHLAELHGGAIEATPGGDGHGATFIVRLPVHDSRLVEQGERPAALAELALDGVRVLVVDDEPDSRELVQRVLEERHVTVDTAGSAAEALERIKQGGIDVLISDIGMPDSDGYQLLREVRHLPGGQRLPAIALTAFARREDRTRSLIEGYQLHLSKPVEPAELIASVARLAGGSRGATASG